MMKWRDVDGNGTDNGDGNDDDDGNDDNDSCCFSFSNTSNHFVCFSRIISELNIYSADFVTLNNIIRLIFGVMPEIILIPL